MVLYLTYNDQPSGVYWSQVTDVVAHLNAIGQEEVKLVALVSVRDLRHTKARIKARSPGAWVIPMVPRMKRWRWNMPVLAGVCRMLHPRAIICRGPFATSMALRMRRRGLVQRVCYDGRGAYAAEWEEYRIIDDDALIAEFRPVEREAVLQSDFRIAVSQALVAHWQERYAYDGEGHAVIPCTLGVAPQDPAPQERERIRQALGYAPTDLVLVYAGSTAGWQSFGLLETLLTRLMKQQPEVKVLFLSRADANTTRLMEGHPDRVQVRWLDPAEVPGTLQACDHGILVREDTLTNRVASPTKFAEYLAAGLPVIISPHLGDFSALVQQEGLGVVVEGSTVPVLHPVAEEERQRLRGVAWERFTKAVYDPAYRRLLG